MEKVLVTGATGFIGYHLVKVLNGRGIRPRVLVRPASNTSQLEKLQVDPVIGDITDPATLAPALTGIDTLFHAAARVGRYTAKQVHLANVVGTRHVLDAAERASPRRIVVTSSVAAVGVNPEPRPLDESADWSVYGMDYPYAATKREAEEDALGRASRGLPLVVVSPCIVIGPEDFAPTPGGQVVRDLMQGRIPGWIRSGLAYVDARDVAAGHLLAAERGRVGERYILCAENVMLEQFFRAVAGAAGVRPPRWRLPNRLVYAAAAISEVWAKPTGRLPGLTRNIIRIAGRYSWYDATKARSELGWSPRPLTETIRDTVAWWQGRG